LSSTLFDYEWQFLLQLITRIYNTETYNDMCDTLLQQLKTLIPYKSGIIFQTGRENGHAVLFNPISTENIDDSSAHNFFTEGAYPHWNEFIMTPYSMVFRQSDIITAAKWEKTRVFRDVWHPKGIYWGIFMSLVHKDIPLSLVGIMRERPADDFTARDLYIMNILKDPLERKFHALSEDKTKRLSGTLSDRIIKSAANMGLTKREIEIASLVCSGKGSEEICQLLYITHATLSKHLSNIYSKTKVKNRTQLFSLFN